MIWHLSLLPASSFTMSCSLTLHSTCSGHSEPLYLTGFFLLLSSGTFFYLHLGPTAHSNKRHIFQLQTLSCLSHELSHIQGGSRPCCSDLWEAPVLYAPLPPCLAPIKALITLDLASFENVSPIKL